MSLTLNTGPGEQVRSEVEGLRKSSVLMLILGVVLIIVGLVAISATFVATLATVIAVACLMLVGGVVEIVNAFGARGWRGFGLHLLAGILYVVLGLLMLNRPEAAAAVFTLMIAAAFVIGGLFRIFTSLITQFHGWVWVLLNGIVTLILGILIWREWPESAFWVIGLFVGIDLVFDGMSWVMTALTVRGATKHAGA